MDNTYLTANFNSLVDLDTEFVSCHVRLTLVDIETDVETEIGSAILYIINVFRYKDWSEIVDAADAISGDMYSIVEGVADVLDEESDFFGLLAILDHIKIDNEFLRKGYGTQSMEEIIKYLEIMSVDYIALIPSPFEQENEVKKKENAQRLVKFYE